MNIFNDIIHTRSKDNKIFSTLKCMYTVFYDY